MRLLTILFLILLTTLSVAQPSREYLRKYVVLVENKWGGHGSGIILRQGILTAFHVICRVDSVGRPELDPKPVVTTLYGKTLHVELSKGNSRDDLALLEGPEVTEVPYTSLAYNPLHIGDQIVLVGCGAGDAAVTKDGKVIRLGEAVVTDGLVVHGDSGGAMFDKNDDVVGSIRGIYRSNGNGVVTNLETIKKFLKE